jgi:hypothetical protein
MIQDRFRLQPTVNIGHAWSPGNANDGSDYPTLNAFIPTLQGYMKLH